MKQAPKASRWMYLFAALPKATYLETIHLTPSETNTYLFLVDRLNGKTRDGWTIPISDQEMMDALGYRRETISRARTGLVEKGMIIQVDHELRQKRVFYVAPPEMVYQMKLCLLAVLLREARKEGFWVEKVKRPPKPPHQPTGGGTNTPSTVRACSQNEASDNDAKPDVACVSADLPALRKDLSLDICKDNLSPSIPVPDEKMNEQVEEKRERDLADLFYEEVLERPLTDSQKRQQIHRDCKRLIADIASDSRVGSILAARDVLMDAFSRVKGYDPYSFGVMTTDYGERSIEAAIKAHQTRTETPLSAETLGESDLPQSDSTEPCDDRPDTPPTACQSKLSVEERIRYLLAATKYRDPDHAVMILQRHDNTLAREDIIRVLSAVERERSDHPRPLIECLSKSAVVEGGRRAASECAEKESFFRVTS
jgi:hypothetical protein